MLLFSDLKALVKDEANRDDLSDALLTSKIQQAVTFIERNYSLKYMERFVEVPLLGNALRPGPYALPSNYKSPILFRLKRIEADGTGAYTYLTATEAVDLDGILSGAPRHYWVEGQSFFWLDAIPEANVAAELLYNRYSGKFGDGDGSWLFEFGLDVVIGQSMKFLGPFLKYNGDVSNGYKEMFTEGVRTLLLADEEERRKAPALMGQYGRPRE